MRKLFLLFFSAALAASVSAQTLTESKTFDNMYIGVNGGIMSKTTQHNGWLNNFDANIGVRLGRYFTPVFGLAVESNVYFPNRPSQMNHLDVGSVNTMGLATVNLMNWFGGYKGEPRLFEISVLYGLGWSHVFGHKSDNNRRNAMSSKAALDFGFNVGAKKAWQIYIEPAMIWGLGCTGDEGHHGSEYCIDQSGFQLNVGFLYKFKNSNGTHNFTIAELRDQAEIDALNAKINELRDIIGQKDAELGAKDRIIEELKAALDECNNRPVEVIDETRTNLQPTVLFQVGKYTVDKAQYAPIELIAQYMKNHEDANVHIKGYASPEGDPEKNQILSENRAAEVKRILVEKYNISADRLTTQGCGATDQLFEQIEFNRVATFNDTTK